jgi:hypothetical protein
MAIIKGKRSRPRRCMLYGVHGIGKSTAVKDFLLVDLEDGSGDIDVAARWDSVPQSYEEFKSVLGELIRDGFEAPGLAIDTADWLEYLLAKEVCRAEGVKTLAEVPYGKGPAMLVPLWEHLLDGFERLAAKHSKHVVLLCHSQIMTVRRPGLESFQRYEPALTKETSKLIQEWADEVLFYRYRDVLRTEKEGFGKERKVALDVRERYIQTSETMIAAAKNRLGLPDELSNFGEYLARLTT